MPRQLVRDFGSSVSPKTAGGGAFTIAGDATLRERCYSFWYRGTSVTSRTVFRHGPNTGAFYVSTTTSQQVLWQLESSTYRYFSATNKVVVDGRWHHLLVYNAGTSAASIASCRVFLDGIEMTGGTTASVNPPNAWNALVFNDIDPGGAVTDVRLFSGMPTAGEIDALYRLGQNPSSVSVTHWIKCNEGTGTTAADSSGNGNNGTLSGAAAFVFDAPRRQTQNQLLWSEAFDNAIWTKTRSTIIANATAAPDGTATADKVVEDSTASATHIVYQTTAAILGTSTLRTFSVYAKAAERTFIAVFQDGSNQGAWFDIGSGAVGTLELSAGGSAAISPAGNGWYRCSITSTNLVAPTNHDYEIYVANANGSVTYSGDGASGAYVWGAQVNADSVVLPYRRVDAVSVEPNPRSRIATKQNLLKYSEDLSNSAWTKHACSISADAAVAPDGTTTADAIVEDGTTDYHYVIQSLGTAIPITQPACFTIWLKAAGRNFAMIQMLGTGMNLGINLTTGETTTAPAGTIVTACPNGWWKVSITRSTGMASVVVYAASTLTTDPSYAGTNALVAIYAWGAQAVQSNYAGPYCKTTTSVFNEGPIR